MNMFGRTFQYLDKGQDKRTNHQTLLVLLFASIIILFIPMLLKLFQMRSVEGYASPAEFGLSTLAIASSSWFLYRSKTHKARDAYRKLQLSLLIALLAGTLFFIFQYAGWMKVYASLNAKDHKIILAIVLVHAIHFFVAFLCLLILFVRICGIKSSAESFIFFLNPKRNAGFFATRTYWDFLGFLWSGLYIVILLKSI